MKFHKAKIQKGIGFTSLILSNQLIKIENKGGNQENGPLNRSGGLMENLIVMTN